MSSKPAVALTELRPSEIWYTFGRVRSTFSGCGRALEDTLEEIKLGRLRASELPPIAVITHDAEDDAEDGDESDDDERRKRRGAGKSSARAKAKTVRRYYSMNNRRLWVLKRCEELGLIETVGVRMESAESCARLLRKGSRNFRLDRCTPGPVKIVKEPERERGGGGVAAATAAAARETEPGEQEAR